MTWKNLTKKTIIINKRSLHKKTVRSIIKTGFHYNKKSTFSAIIILSVIALSAVIGDFSSNNSVVMANSVQGIGVGVYWDQNCTNRTLSPNWGSIKPELSSNLTVYVKNEDNTPVTLTLSASKWTSLSTQSYMSLNWNYTKQVLNPKEVIPTEITLSVSPTICDISNFSLEITISSISEN